VLQVRVVCPADQSGGLVEVLRHHPGATNVTCLGHVVLEPAADAITADVAREAAGPLLDKLREAGVEDSGSVVLSTLDTALGRSIERAEQESAGHEDDALIWEELESTTSEESTLSVSFLIFLVIATMIAAIGLLTDSPILIVGAMVVGPEFGPLAGLAVAVKRRKWSHARQSLRALAVGFPLAIVVTALGVALLDAAGRIPAGYRAGHHPLTSFVAQPGLFSVIVALIAGVAGTVSLTAAKSSALVGVFISVTTVPAAAGVAVAGVTGRGADAVGSLVQLLVNLCCIFAAALATLTIQERALAASGGAERAAPTG
jgi:uncharacterized hydrophobic protein (TIGR00271 family)